MRARKENEWMDIKELNPLGFMPYVARQFQKVTGVSLSGLDDFRGWVGIGGYYPWRLSELGQLHTCPRLQGQPLPDRPIGQPNGWPLPMPTLTETPMSGASQQGGNQPSNRVGPPEVGIKLPQEVPSTCPQREQEVAMDSHGSTCLSRMPHGRRVEVRALHT